MAGVHRRLAGGVRRWGTRVNGISAEELMDCWEAGGCGYDAAVLDRLWASVPPQLRLPRLSADTVPGCYRGGFAGAGRQARSLMSAVFPARCGRR